VSQHPKIWPTVSQDSNKLSVIPIELLLTYDTNKWSTVDFVSLKAWFQPKIHRLAVVLLSGREGQPQLCKQIAGAGNGCWVLPDQLHHRLNWLIWLQHYTSVVATVSLQFLQNTATFKQISAYCQLMYNTGATTTADSEETVSCHYHIQVDHWHSHCVTVSKVNMCNTAVTQDDLWQPLPNCV